MKMGSYIRLHKTPKNQRNTYKVIDEQGNVVCEICPGEDGITEEDIHNCHKVDDMEVCENLKSFCPKFPDWLQKDIETWQEQEREKFIADSGREPRWDELPRYKHLISLDDFMDSEKYGDNCNILAEELLRQQKTDPPEVEELRELVATFPSSWQEIYRLILIAGVPVVQVAKARGVTDMAIHKTVKKIRKRIAEDENLKKIFQGV